MVSKFAAASAKCMGIKTTPTVVLRAWVTQRTTVGVVFIPMHFAEAAANLLTIDALDPVAKIPEYKACAVRIVPAAETDLARPEAKVERGRY